MERPELDPGGPPAAARWGVLDGVSVASARSAWAVGSQGRNLGRPVILHWNGTAWKRGGAPAERYAALTGVAAASGSRAWAVGVILGGTLIDTWNGHAWTSWTWK